MNRFAWARILWRLRPSVREHRAVEDRAYRFARQVLPAASLGERTPAPAGGAYLQKHAFSILFLAIYRALGVPAPRRRLYGVVNHAIRGIVTAADNVLDDEYKEMLPLEPRERAPRFKSILHILVFDRLLTRALEEARDDGAIAPGQAWELQRRLLGALASIGQEEASEEGGVEGLWPPDRVVAEVHHHKGGKLLSLAFVAPRLLETERAAAVDRAEGGVYRVGLALQAVDDLVDAYDDARDRHHNLLLSTVAHEGTEEERRVLEGLRRGERPDRPVERAFPQSAARVMTRAVGVALDGFAQLEQAGFWLDASAAPALIERLFHLRGAAALLALLPPGGLRGGDG